MSALRSRYFLAPAIAIAALAWPELARAQSAVLRSPIGAEALGYADEQPIAYGDSRRFAYDEGYREGIKEGERDARRGDRFAYQDEREFRDADRGYRRNYGDRERYRQSFRSGYATGYSDAYRRIGNSSRGGGYGDPRYGNSNPRYGNVNPGYGGYGNRGYYSPAFDNGARDGYEKGQEDARKNRSFDPLRHSWYRSGDRHYEREYGLRDEYKNVYRRGFQQGYERGFREGRYRW